MNKSCENLSGFIPRAIKTKPTSPKAKESESTRDKVQAHKKWKRKAGDNDRKKSLKIELGTKRKEDLMDVDDLFLGDAKKPKNTRDDLYAELILDYKKF